MNDNTHLPATRLGRRAFHRSLWRTVEKPPGHPPGRLRQRPMLAVLFVLLVLGALPGRSGTLDAAQIKETVFPSGLRLIVKEARATDLAAVQVWIRAGGFREDETTSGTAHVIEHLLFHGSEERDPGSLDAEIESVGGLLEASTEKDWTRLNCTVNGRYVGKVLSAVGNALRKAQFRLADLELEKKIIEEEISQIQFNPEALVASALYALAFQKHPYRYDVRGTKQFLNQLRPDAIRAYYQEHYGPSSMTVVVVGDVDRAGVERATRAGFQADRPAAPAGAKSIPPDETACAGRRTKTLPGRFRSGFVGIAYPAPSVKDLPDTFVMDLILTMLESGGSGRLPRLLKGMGVSATYETRRQAGLFTVVSATGAADVDQVEALIRKEVEFLADHPVPDAEVAVTKRTLRGSYALDNEPYTGQASTLGYYASIDRWQFASDYLARVDAVTPQQLQEVARKYLSAEHSVSVLMKPASTPGPRPPARTGT